jgi:hypothetical protein
MASIKITELRPVGVELFQDRESFLDELNDRETSLLLGGKKSGDANISVISVETESFGISIVTFTVVTQVKKVKIKIK